MSELIKSITTETLSINEILLEAFETASGVTPTADTVVLSYNTTSETIGKTILPPDATSVASNAKTEALAANQTAQSALTLAQQASKKQTLPSSTRALPFTCDPTIINSFTTTEDVTYSIDETNPADGNCIVLSIIQNHKIIFPSNFSAYPNSMDEVMGVENQYYIFRQFGRYFYIRVVPLPIALATPVLTVGLVTQHEVPLTWDMVTNAVSFSLKRSVTSDGAVQNEIYNGPGLSFTDTQREPGTTYYYFITAINGANASAVGFTEATTLVDDNVIAEDLMLGLGYQANSLIGATGWSIETGTPTIQTNVNKLLIDSKDIVISGSTGNRLVTRSLNDQILNSYLLTGEVNFINSQLTFPDFHIFNLLGIMDSTGKQIAYLSMRLDGNIYINNTVISAFTPADINSFQAFYFSYSSGSLIFKFGSYNPVTITSTWDGGADISNPAKLLINQNVIDGRSDTTAMDLWDLKFAGSKP